MCTFILWNGKILRNIYWYVLLKSRMNVEKKMILINSIITFNL